MHGPAVENGLIRQQINLNNSKVLLNGRTLRF